MRQEINIGTKPIELEVNALTPILYKKAFKSDFIRELQNLRSGKNSDGMAEFFPRVAFVAMKQAKHDYRFADEEFYTFVSEFNALDFANSAADIMMMISGSEKTTSEAKN